MIVSPVRHVLPLLLFLLTIPNAPFLTGQVFPEDVRVSPAEPFHYDLLPDYKIQSAERQGGHALVVWGTTRAIAEGKVAGELRSQAFENSAISGAQKILTDTAARPFGFVQVIASEQFFLVVWNDRREKRGGIYAQRVSPTGELLGREVWISPRHAIVWDWRFPGITVIDTDNGKLLIWREYKQVGGNLNSLRLKGNGQLVFPVGRIASDLQAIWRFGAFPGVAFLQVSDSLGLMVDRNGEVDAREIRWPRNGIPFNLGADSSLVLLEDGGLHYFSSVFADTAAWSVGLPFLDSAVAGTAMVSRDSLGQFRVYFTTLHITGSNQAEGFVTVSEYRVDIAGPASVSDPVPVHQDRFLNGYNGYTTILSSSLESAAYEQGNDNTGRARLTLSRTQSTWGNPPGFGTVDLYYSVNRSGRLYPDATGFLPLFTATPSFVSRIERDGSSAVRVLFSDTALEVSAPVAPRNVPNSVTRPLVAFAQDSLVHCFWIDSLHGPTLANAILPFTSAATIVDRLKSEQLPSFSYGTYGSIGRITSVYCEQRSNNDLFVSGGLFGYQSFHISLCRVEEYYSPLSSTHYVDYRYRTRVNIPSTRGWLPAVIFDGTGREYFEEPTGIRAIVGGYDPDRDELMVMTAGPEIIRQGGEWSCSVFNRNGSRKWGMDAIRFRGNEKILPVDSLVYLRITTDSAVLCRESSTISSYRLPPSGRHANYQRLYGPYFLRTSWLDEASTEFSMELFHITDGLVAERTLSIPERVGLVSYARRKEDSAIVVLWGTEHNGIRAAVLDRTLSVRALDIPVSRRRGKALNPSGIFRDSTLYVVWEDYRGGIAEIYANAVVPSVPDTATGVDEREEGTEFVTLSIDPNPARDLIGVRIGGQVPEDGQVELIDMLGNRLRAEPVTRNSCRAVLDGRSLAPGLYFVRLRSAGSVTIAKVVVR